MLVEQKKIFLNLTPRIRIRSTTSLLLILFTLSINSYGQKIILSKWKKGFIALEHYDFFRARKLFIKSLKRHTAPAAFGLSLVHLDDLNYFHSLDSAYFRINQADSAFDKLEKKSKEKLKPYGLSDSAIKLIRSEIFFKAWKNANNENSVSGFQHYADYFIDSPFQKEAIKKRNALAYKNADSINSAAAYSEFIRKYPEASEHNIAQIKLDDAIYIEQTIDNTISSFELFIKNNPSSRHLSDAENAIYKIAVPHETEALLYSFVTTYPSNRNTQMAWEKLYSIYTGDQRKESIESFRVKYPDYPFKDKINKDAALTSTRLFPVFKEDKWGYVDSTGQLIIDYLYEEAGFFHENIAAVRLNNKTGYINKSGKLVIKPTFDDGYDFKSGYAIIEKDSLYGLIDARENVIIPPFYSAIYGPFGKLFRLEKNDRVTFFHAGFNRFIDHQQDETGDFTDQMCMIGKDGKKGFIDTSGNIVIMLQYSDVQPFERGTSIVKLNELTGLIDKNGKEVIKILYDQIENYSLNELRVIQKVKCALAERNGKFLGPFKTECPSQQTEALIYNEGLTPFQRNGLWGFKNKKEVAVIKPEYESVKPFSNGMALVRKSGRFLFIDRKGHSLLAYELEDLTELDGHYIITKQGKKGLMDFALKELLPAEFDAIKKSKESGILEIFKNGKFAFYSILSGSIFWKEEGF